jgi:hypothetical protein
MGSRASYEIPGDYGNGGGMIPQIGVATRFAVRRAANREALLPWNLPLARRMRTRPPLSENVIYLVRAASFSVVRARLRVLELRTLAMTLSGGSMSVENTHAAGEELQFDRAVSNAPAAAPTGKPAVVCKACSKAIDGDYFQLNGKVTCASCRTAIEASVATPKDVATFARAAGLGVLAAIAGAALYYGVIAIANLEIGIIAIAIGYMVGWAIRKGTGGRGGLRFQILAVALTYWAVGLAYAPLFMKAASIPLPVMFFEVFTLPILVVTGGASGIITAIIIAVGMRQAWRMTGGPALKIAGPIRVGSGASPAAV